MTTDTTDNTALPKEGWQFWVDRGGTFTDIVAIRDRDSWPRTAKVPSRPDDPVAALLDALRAVDVEPAEVANLIHGTTRITNAIVEGKMPPVALVTTAGFEDVLAIERLRRRDLYRLDVPPKLAPLVPAVPGRVLRDDVDLLHTRGPEQDGFPHEFVDRLRSVQATHQRDRTKRARVVASLADLEVRRVQCVAGQHAEGLLHHRDRPLRREITARAERRDEPLELP